MGVELTPDEIDSYMLQSPRVILCIAREGLAPLPLPMWFGWIDRTIVMHTMLSSKKMEHLQRNPRVSCLVESGEHYYTLKAVLAIGTCEISEDAADVARVREAIWENKPFYREWTPEQWPPHLERHYAKPRVALRVKPDSLTSWDFAKIRH